MIVPQKILDQHVIVLGKTRSGKSSTMRVLVENILDDSKPVCVVDPKGDWWGLKASADGKKAGYPVVIFGGEHADVPLNSKSGAAVAELAATGNRPCIIDLGGWMPGARTEFFIDFASGFFKASRGRRWLVIDEVHNFAPQGKVLDVQAGKMLHWGNRLASEGLGKGIALIAASQRPQKVHKDFVTSAETLIAMRVIHPLDRGAIKDWIDGCGDPEKGKEVLATLASMERGEAWVWSPEIDFGPKRVQFPMFTTYDSFKAQSTEQPAKLKGWADVDLEEVKGKLAAAIKEAEANDPKKLQARIRELEGKLREKPHWAPATVDHKAVERAVQQAIAPFQKRFKEIADTIGHAIRYGGLMNDAVGKAHNLAKLQKEPKPIAPAPTMVRETPRAAVAELNGDFSGPETKILTALAQLRAIGKEVVPKAMVAGWSGYSPTSGGYANLLGGLRAKGAIEYPGSATVKLTSHGIVATGDVPPPDQSEIKLNILSVCRGSEQKILKILLDNGPEEMSRSEVARLTEYSETSGGFANLLGSLRTKGFLDYPRTGFVQPAAWLFP